MDYQYDVFLSYRHKPLDGVITQKTFNMLEGYRLPASLKARGWAYTKSWPEAERRLPRRLSPRRKTILAEF